MRSSNPRVRAAENLAATKDDFAPPAKPVRFTESSRVGLFCCVQAMSRKDFHRFCASLSFPSPTFVLSRRPLAPCQLPLSFFRICRRCRLGLHPGTRYRRQPSHGIQTPPFMLISMNYAIKTLFASINRARVVSVVVTHLSFYDFCSRAWKTA